MHPLPGPSWKGVIPRASRTFAPRQGIRGTVTSPGAARGAFKHNASAPATLAGAMAFRDAIQMPVDTTTFSIACAVVQEFRGRRLIPG